MNNHYKKNEDGVTQLKIKCVNCEKVQDKVKADKHGTYCCKVCGRSPYTLYGSQTLRAYN